MAATIHYLRPFEREEPATQDDGARDRDEAPSPERRERSRGRSMPCGRKSGWKKKIGGGVVPRKT